jgi:hypothetical protein
MYHFGLRTGDVRQRGLARVVRGKVLREGRMLQQLVQC